MCKYCQDENRLRSILFNSLIITLKYMRNLLHFPDKVRKKATATPNCLQLLKIKRYLRAIVWYLSQCWYSLHFAVGKPTWFYFYHTLYNRRDFEFHIDKIYNYKCILTASISSAEGISLICNEYNILIATLPVTALPLISSV